MDAHLKQFIRSWAGVVVATIAPVVLTAFAGIPFALGYQPGEAPVGLATVERHPS